MKKTMTMRLLAALAAVAALALPARADAPAVRGTSVTLKGPATAEEIAAADQELRKNGKPARITVSASKIDDATFAALAKAWAEATSLTVSDSTLTTLAPLADMKALTALTLRKLASANPLDAAPLAGLAEMQRLEIVELKLGCPDLTFLSAMAKLRALEFNKLPGGFQSLKGLETLPALTDLSLKGMELPDLAPLAACAKVDRLHLNYSTLGDLTPVGAMPALKFLDAYGSKLKQDFAPLAASKTLNEIMYYAAELPNDDFSSLGKLKQAKIFHGGLTKMTSVEWVKEVPQIERLYLFVEKVGDLSPIASAAKLTLFRGWKMELGDLAYLNGKADLATVELPDSNYSTTAPLATLPNLETADLSEAKQPVDLAFVKSCPKLKRLTFNKSTVVNFEALAGHPALQTISFRDAKGLPAALDFLGDCPKLTTVYASKESLTDAQAQAIKDKAAAAGRKISVNK